MELKDTKYFKVSEILRSNTAKKHNIDNTPTDETIIDNLNYTLNRLNEIREQYGKPIYINSGYRCDELNLLVGGVNDSKHRLGLAVDLRWDTDLIDFLIENCSFDKLIREKAGKSKWIHLQFKRDRSKEANNVISINK